MDLNDYKLQKDTEDLYCWFKARNNLIKILLEKTIGVFSDNKILDIGCGTGTELEILKKFGEVTALDINQESLSIAQEKKIKTVLADIEKENLEENTYTHICAFDILEHLEKDRLVLEKLHETLKEKGFLVFTVPAFPSLFSEHDIALEHKRRYTKKELIKKLEDANFTIEKIGYWNSILFPVIAGVRIIKNFVSKIIPPKKAEAETKQLNKNLNKILFEILDIDNKLIKKKIDAPYGLSLYGIARK